MSDERTKQNGKPKRKRIPKAIIGAIIGGVCAIIAAIIPLYFLKFKVYQISVHLLDVENQKRISGVIYINDDQEGQFITAGEPATVIELKRKRYTIKAESSGYQSREITTTKLPNPLVITMTFDGLIPLPMVGWTPWNGISISEGTRINECIINSNGRIPDAAGFVNTAVTAGLRGKTLVLYFSNSRASNFSEKRMVKLECSHQPRVLSPTGGIPMIGDYLAAMDTTPDRGIEYLIPDDFDGRLNFVFYQAELNDLKITAFYK